MENVKKLSVTVAAASGHGVHSLLPSETAYCVLEVPGSLRGRTQTEAVAAAKDGAHWDETVEFEYEGGTPRSLHLEVHGVLGAHGADDLVGAGDLDLHEVLERGTRQVVEVPLTKGGHELGCVELCIQHRAMPDRG